MGDLHLPSKLIRESITFPPLDGKNYPSCKRSMRVLFMRMDLLELIESRKPVDANYQWDRADKWAFSEIYFRCGPESQQSLTEDMSARQAWKMLEDLFQSSSLEYKFRLYTDFNTLKQVAGQSAIQFINSVLSAATVLRYLGEDVSDQIIKWQLLGNLLPEYDALVTTLTIIDNIDNPLDIGMVRESIMREERQLLLNKARISHLATKEPEMILKASSGQDERKSCSHCGSSTHEQDRCWDIHPELRPLWYKPRRENEHDKENRGRYKNEDKGRNENKGRSTNSTRRKERREKRRKRKYEEKQEKGFQKELEEEVS